MSKVRHTFWVRPSKLLWLPMLAAAAGALWVFGTPHLLWEYQYLGKAEPRLMLSCDYIGRHAQTVPSIDGHCPLIMFFRSTGELP